MSRYQLLCRGESGNCYKVALMLNLIDADWEPVLVGFFNDETKAAFKQSDNEMGELPTLILDDGKKLSQSGAILDYLARKSGKFGAATLEDQNEILRWLLFDNHRFTPPFATLRFMIGLRKAEESMLTQYLRSQAQAAYEVLDHHLRDREFVVGTAPTIADISMVGYLYYDEEINFDRTRFQNVQAWAKRIKALPGWAAPYALMPRASQGA